MRFQPIFGTSHPLHPPEAEENQKRPVLIGLRADWRKEKLAFIEDCIGSEATR